MERPPPASRHQAIPAQMLQANSHVESVRSSTVLPSLVLQLQRRIGNAATARILQRTDDDESFLKTLAKQEGMGLWGMLKGMGMGAAGVVDSASTGITKGLRAAGLDAADPLQFAKMLEKQYDASGEALFGKDYAHGEALIGGMDAGQIGSAGGGLIWQLVMAGAGPGGSLAGAKTGIDVVSNLGSMIDAANKIAEVIEKKQKQDQLSASDLLTDGEFLQACSALALSIGTMMAAGKKLDANAAPALLKSLERLGIAATSAQALATINKIIEIQTSTKMSPQAQQQATAAAVVELIGQGLSIISDVVGNKEIGGGQKDPASVEPHPANSGPEDPHTAPLQLDTESAWRGNQSPEDFDPSLRDLPVDPNAAPLELDTEGTWQGNQSPEDFDPSLRDLPVDNNAAPLKLGKGRKRPAPQTVTEETGLGSPGTGPGGKSLRSTGMNVNTYDAAEAALGLRKDYRASPDHGGYQYLNSVEFDVPSVTGNEGTRGDRFGNDAMVDSLGINYPKNDDYTGTGSDRGHGAAQELSGGDPDVARALQTMTNIWPQTPETNQHGGYRQLENFYKDLKQQNPGAHVRVRIEGVYGNPPQLVTTPSGSRLAVPQDFAAAITIEKPDGSKQVITRTIPN